MLDPNNLQRVNVNENVDIVVIPNLPPFDIKEYDIFDDKDFRKFIADIEKTVRGSYEYSCMINFLRENMNMNQCSFYQNVTNIDTTKIRIEIHHAPLSLYDITIIVFNKRNCYHESLEVEAIAKEVMFLHYNLLVGLIPLSETVHELVHNNYLFIPADKVLGNYKQFLAAYEEFMTPEQIDTMDRILEFTKTYNEKYDMADILEKKFVYVDIAGAYELPLLQEVLQAMSDKINVLKSNNTIFSSNNTNVMVKAVEFEKEE